MNNLTKIKILKPANEIFEAFVVPEKIGGFWFSSSSERWQEGKTVTLRYEEYNAEVEITIKEIQENKEIVFEWGGDHLVTITFDEVDSNITIVSIIEEGFLEESEDFIAQILDNKEGWVYTLTCLKAYMEFGVTTLRASLLK